MSAYPPPRLSNGVINTVFNAVDFQDKTAIEFIPTTGGTTTGSLSVGGRVEATEITSTGDVTADTLTANAIILNNDNVVLGNGSTVSSTNAVAVGHDAYVDGSGSVAIGYGSSTSTYTNAVAIGPGATATRNNEFVLGTSSSNYRLAGILGSGSNFMRRGISTTQSGGFLIVDWDTSLSGNTSSASPYLQWDTVNKLFSNISGRNLLLQVSCNITTSNPSAYSITQIQLLLADGTTIDNTNAKNYSNNQVAGVSAMFVIPTGYHFRTTHYANSSGNIDLTSEMNILVLN